MQDHNRFPALHANTHKRNGSDQILLDEFGVPRDVTLLNSTDQYHGLLPKLSDVTNQFLRGDGTWAVPSGGGGGGGGGNVTGSGAAGSIAVWDGSSDITAFADFLYDDTTKKMFVGTTTFPTVESDDDPRWIFSFASAHFTDFIVINTSSATSAGTEITVFNKNSNGVSLTVFNDNWDGSTAVGFNPGDAGLGYRSGTGTTAANARLILASGPLPIAFINNGGGTSTEQGRVASDGTLIWGGTATAGTDPGHSLIEVQKNQNHFTGFTAQNTTDGTASSCGWVFIGPSGNVGFMTLNAPGFTAGGAGSPAHCININTNGNWPIVFTTNNAARVYIAGTGELLVNLTAPTDSGHYMLEVMHNQNTYTGIDIWNTTNGTASVTTFTLFGPTVGSLRIGEFKMTAPGFTPGGGYDADQVIIDNHNSAGGINILCEGSFPIKLKTNASIRYQIDGNGNMAWFGGATQGQPTVTGSRGGNAALASFLTAIAGFNLIIDNTTP